MVTTKQEKVIPAIVENGGNVSKAMMAVGYSPNTAHTPQKLTESKGFKKQMAKLGLTEDLITKALVADIKGKPKKRFLELSLGAEILNMKKRIDPADERPTHTTNIVIITPNASPN